MQYFLVLKGLNEELLVVDTEVTFRRQRYDLLEQTSGHLSRTSHEVIDHFCHVNIEGASSFWGNKLDWLSLSLILSSLYLYVDLSP